MNGEEDSVDEGLKLDNCLEAELRQVVFQSTQKHPQFRIQTPIAEEPRNFKILAEDGLVGVAHESVQHLETVEVSLWCEQA